MPKTNPPKFGATKLGVPKKTERGFAFIGFKDHYEIPCSIQESSGDTPCLWLGCDCANPRQLIPGQGWTPIKMPEGYLADTRMLLNRKQVIALVYHLQKWLVTDSIA